MNCSASNCAPTAPCDDQRAADDLTNSEISVTRLGARELAEHVDVWRRLSETAVEPNVFYEPCTLLSAVEQLGGGCDLEFVVVTARSRNHPERPPVWCGFFPLERKRMGMLGYFQLWKYEHCFLCTPLVRADVAHEALAAFFQWLNDQTRGRSCLKLDGISGDGPFHQVLIDVCHRHEYGCWMSARHSRALFRRASDSENYFSRSLPGKRRQELRRRAKRLADQGHVEYDLLERAEDLAASVAEFLDLESRGWKGHNGTALACEQADREFFHEMARRAFDDGQLMLASLRLNDRPVAMTCNVTSGEGAFGFKTAFDETFARFSPGVLLVAHTIETLHERDDVLWMDSCADPDHAMINHLWKDRRIIESLWIAGPSASAQMALALMPMARMCRDRLSVLRRRGSPRSTKKKT